ncbi:MAG: MFS transporter [Chloroflexi bacterium]|nr:MFS transporter [Chloroflexota bacterium]MDA1145794.1 MFS transporter [Chloroflexota bacterium]
MRRSFAALSIRSFAILWAGSLGSMTGFFMSTVVQAIVAFDLTGRNGAVGLVLVGQGVSQAVLGPFGGTLADRASKKLVTITGQLITMTVFIVTGMLLAADRIELYHLAIGSLINGATFAFIGPSRQAWVVEIVGSELRGNAVALNQVALNAARIWAPAIAGLMVAAATIGASGAYFAMAALYVVSTVSLLWVPSARNKGGPGRPSMWVDLIAGLRYVGGEPRLRWMLTLFFMLILLGLSSTTVLPGFVSNELGRDAEDFGILQTANAIGGLIASLAVASIASSPRALTIYSAGGVLGGIALMLTGLAPTLVIVLIPMFLFGVGLGAFQTLNSALIVTEADPRYYGRVASLTFLAFAGFQLVSLPVGLAADAFGERATLIALGALSVTSVLVIAPIIARTPKVRRFDEPAAPAAAAGGS